MTSGPVSPDPGRDEDPARSPGEPGGSRSGGSGHGAGGAPDEFPGDGWREVPGSGEDWLTEEQWMAWLSSLEPEEPPAEEDEDDPGADDPSAGPPHPAGSTPQNQPATPYEISFVCRRGPEVLKALREFGPPPHAEFTAARSQYP